MIVISLQWTVLLDHTTCPPPSPVSCVLRDPIAGNGHSPVHHVHLTKPPMEKGLAVLLSAMVCSYHYLLQYFCLVMPCGVVVSTLQSNGHELYPQLGYLGKNLDLKPLLPRIRH